VHDEIPSERDQAARKLEDLIDLEVVRMVDRPRKLRRDETAAGDARESPGVRPDPQVAGPVRQERVDAVAIPRVEQLRSLEAHLRAASDSDPLRHAFRCRDPHRSVGGDDHRADLVVGQAVASGIDPIDQRKPA
jgi:hypothetical protein